MERVNVVRAPQKSDDRAVYHQQENLTHELNQGVRHKDVSPAQDIKGQDERPQENSSNLHCVIGGRHENESGNAVFFLMQD